jgi:hypothetical protein
VYDPSGTRGTITVTAAVSGMAGGAAEVVADPVGLPAQIAVSSTAGTLASDLTASVNGINLSAGAHYTQYTVTLNDAAGVPVPAPAAETFTVTDNAATGAAYLLPSLTGTASLITSSSADTAQVTLSSGASSVTFYVVNTVAQIQPATLTVAAEASDLASVSPATALSATATVPYVFEAGPAVALTVTGPGRLLQGTSAVYTIGLTDVNHNMVPETGTVALTVSGGATFANGSTSATVTLDSEGLASIAVYTMSGATGPITLTAAMGSLTTAITPDVVNLTSLVANLAVETGSPAAVVPSSGIALAGLASATFTVYEENAAGAVVGATDNVEVTISNPSALILENGSTIVAGSTLVLPASDFTSSSGATFTVLGGASGTATVTVTDMSNPAVPAVSFPVSVEAVTVTAASETGAGNGPGDIATITVNGLPTYAYYADNVADFAEYNQATGVVEILTPTIMDITAVGVYDPTTAAYVPNTGNRPAAVWDINGTYYYLMLDETANAAGTAPGNAYVGLTVTGPAGSRVEMGINGGALDGNTSNSDRVQIPVATESSTRQWMVAPARTLKVVAEVSLPSPGPTIAYPLTVQQP